MKQLTRHIEKLLLRHDCVIIPGFGGFMAHHVDACYEESEQLFLPPSRSIGFNAQLTMNDSLLVQSYAESEDISYPEALTIIENEVEWLKLHIEQTGEYEFSGIGKITLNEEGNMVFAPFEGGILTPSLYGLGLIDIAPRQEIVRPVLQPIQQEEENAPAAQVIAIQEDEEQDADEGRISIKLTTLRTIAAACIALVLFFTLPSSLNNGTSTNFAKIDSGSSLLHILPKSITSQNGELPQIAAIEEPQQSANTISAPQEPTTKETPTAKPSYYYSIVLASQVSKKNAQALVDQLNSKGYTGAEVLQQKFTRVVYGVFTTESAAYEKLRQMQDVKEFKDAWVLKVKE